MHCSRSTISRIESTLHPWIAAASATLGQGGPWNRIQRRRRVGAPTVSQNKDGVMQPVDMSTFGNATTLNEQEDFISTLYDQLEQQDIPIELILVNQHQGGP